MNGNTAATLINISLIILIGVGIYITHNSWILLGLCFMKGTTTKHIATECPECMHKFTAIDESREVK